MSKLDGIKPGDRVRVTFEGEYHADRYTACFIADGNDGSIGLGDGRTSAPTFHIEKLAPPLKVGDRVRHRGHIAYEDADATILAFASDGRAVVEFDAPSPLGVLPLPVSALEPAQ